MSSEETTSHFLSQEIDIVVEAQVKQTEAKDKVSAAVTNLFRSDGELREEDDIIQFFSQDIESLRFIRDQFRDRQIRAVARRLLLSNGGKDGLSTFLLFNKQAATVSIAVLCEDPSESALGPIVLRIKSSKLAAVIDWLTLSTTNQLKAQETPREDTS